MKLRSAVLVTLLTTLPCLATEESARLHFPAIGFSIEPLESASAAAPYVPLAMAMPRTDGFSPNVNVNIQPYPGSLEDYLELTRRQMQAVGATFVEEPRIDGSTLRLEYAGTLNGRDLRWSAAAVQDGERILLVTATALASQWDDLGARLQRVVESFRLEKGD